MRVRLAVVVALMLTERTMAIGLYLLYEEIVAGFWYFSILLTGIFGLKKVGLSFSAPSNPKLPLSDPSPCMYMAWPHLSLSGGLV